MATGIQRIPFAARCTRAALAAVPPALLALLAAAAPLHAEPADSLRTPPARVRAWQTGLLRSDRLQHASLSFTLAAGAGLAGRPRAEALAFALGVGLLKEIHDARVTRFDPVDLAADAAGATLGSAAGGRR